MKLPDFYDFDALNEVKRRMGIPRDVYGQFTSEERPRRLTDVEITTLKSGPGLVVPFVALTILADGTLAYKDSRVLLHIRDVHTIAKVIAHPPDGKRPTSPRFSRSPDALSEQL